MEVKPMTDYGWMNSEGNLVIEWDSDDNIQAIQQRVRLLTKGCKCATGCSTARCCCKKKGQQCSLGCSCTNCINITEIVPTCSTNRNIADGGDINQHWWGLRQLRNWWTGCLEMTPVTYWTLTCQLKMLNILT